MKASDKNVCSRYTGDPCLKEERIPTDTPPHTAALPFWLKRANGKRTCFLSTMCAPAWGPGRVRDWGRHLQGGLKALPLKCKG